MKKVIVIGGGIVGLSSALYLKSSGFHVTVIDKNDFSDNCSYGNAGYVCPSHFVPLATPGIVQQGLKWMWNSRSPFYVEPRLSWSLFQWGWRFMRVATPEHVANSAVPLRDIALISQRAYESWHKEIPLDMAYMHKGLLELFQTDEKEAYAINLVKKSKALGLDAQLLTKEEVLQLEPGIEMDVRGGVFFGCDAHLYPPKLMRNLLQHLKNMGVEFLPNAEVIGFKKEYNQIRAVETTKGIIEADEVILAAGAWSGELSKQLGLKLPMVGGRGYSITIEDYPHMMNYPAILMESRVALTPMDGNKMRFGGTMEITRTNRPPRMKRVEGIIRGVQRFFPSFEIPMPKPEEVWYGFRPCSADGLPYIGRTAACKNLVVATGHAMIGLSLGAGTGQLVAEIIQGEPSSMDISSFSPDRYA